MAFYTGWPKAWSAFGMVKEVYAVENKILIAYYSMTSHTRRVAELIQNAVGGELASIRTKETYPSDYEAMVEQGRREVNEGFLPVLNEFPVDIDACHMIFWERRCGGTVSLRR